MVWPVKLDHVENDGPGSDIDPILRRQINRDDPLFRPAITKPATMLAAVNDKPFGRPKEGPSLTAAARGGQTCLRSGRKNAYGPVEQKNGVKREDHKALAFRAAIRERRNG
jgi:hypothetical protein